MFTRSCPIQDDVRLQESRYMTRQMLDTAVDPVVVINEYGIIVECNSAACKLFGYQPHELKGT